MPTCPPILIHPDKSRHEPADQTSRVLQTRPITLPNRVVMAPLTRNRAVRRRRPEPDGHRILRPARQRRPDHQRSDADLAAGQGLSGHARHLFEGAGRRLEASHRCRARKGRPHLPPALACRPHLAFDCRERRHAGRASAIRAKGKTFVDGTFTDVSEPRASRFQKFPA